jgi:hypothetical protein
MKKITRKSIGRAMRAYLLRKAGEVPIVDNVDALLVAANSEPVEPEHPLEKLSYEPPAPDIAATFGGDFLRRRKGKKPTPSAGEPPADTEIAPVAYIPPPPEVAELFGGMPKK